jgi:thymidylate synthase (FAD)
MVLDQGEVTLVQHMGDDHMVVQAARISNGAAKPEWRGAPDERLIYYLAEHGHMTPFEHNSFTFYVKAPIFVIREWMRHRTFSYNERSARYKELLADFWMPEHPRIPDPKNRQGSIRVEDDTLSDMLTEKMGDAYEGAYEVYEELLEAGIAREVARAILPVGTYSEMYVTGNFRNWMHFCDLRGSVDAQREIQVYADAILEMISQKMPLSTDAFVRRMK